MSEHDPRHGALRGDGRPLPGSRRPARRVDVDGRDGRGVAGRHPGGGDPPGHRRARGPRPRGAPRDRGRRRPAVAGDRRRRRRGRSALVARRARLTFLADIGSRHRPAPFALEVGADGPVGEPRRLPRRPAFPSSSGPARTARRCSSSSRASMPSRPTGWAPGPWATSRRTPTDEPAWTPVVETTTGHDEWRTTWVVDLATGEARQVSPAGMNTWEADWLGEERVVAIVTDAPAEDAWYASRLVRIGLDDGAVDDAPRPRVAARVRHRLARRVAGRGHRGRRQRPLLHGRGAAARRRGRVRGADAADGRRRACGALAGRRPPRRPRARRVRGHGRDRDDRRRVAGDVARRDGRGRAVRVPLADRAATATS